MLQIHIIPQSHHQLHPISTPGQPLDCRVSMWTCLGSGKSYLEIDVPTKGGSNFNCPFIPHFNSKLNHWTGTCVAPDPQLLVCCVSVEDKPRQWSRHYSTLWVFEKMASWLKFLQYQPCQCTSQLNEVSFPVDAPEKQNLLAGSNLIFVGILHSLNNCTAKEIACTSASSWSHEGGRTIQEQVCGQ